MVEAGPIIVFDGYCVLCDRWVSFIMARDRDRRFRFSPLQSQLGQQIVLRAGAQVHPGESIVLQQDGQVFTKSSAALRILQGLGAPWAVLGILRLLPRVLRDAVYDLVARNRYRWFGRRDACRVPSTEERERFILE